MKCPFCGVEDTSVIDSRENDEGTRIRRRRRCMACAKRFTTYETIELRFPQVIKQDGNRVEFDRNKLLTSFRRALHKRPVTAEQVDAAMEHIIQNLLGSGTQEVQSRTIGKCVMQELYTLDKISYIRFASVYRSFEDIGDFQDAIREVQASPPIDKK